ncbi:electron transfer flavoprotein subunit alpha/FixB family protein [Nesterenkonia jeotgali]|uniref:Electron transfer flavoprotein alpha subunit n=1 Tax=Nesterenkonia jeotgali TaxID=317018 RepID=A0A839FV71_9MICC|nr:electron transfer flavoprotein subunit alpha/FixB family protein [Nesterenkonia jeotgali]MBA8922152.1 electron transfer flavoprotein alpha subunit [Nesterenkonia jeotgali]
MSNVLVFFDVLGETLSSTQRELIAQAQSLGEVHIAIGAYQGDPTPALAISGVGEVYLAEASLPAPEVAVVDLLETAVAECGAEVILGSSTADVTDALARLAVRLDTGIICSIAALTGELVATKSELAGSYTTVSQLAPDLTRPLIATFRPNSLDPQRVDALLDAGTQPDGTVLPVRPSQGGVEVLHREALKVSARPALAEARVVVAGGRGVDGDFTPLEELADELGAGLGASRAATDAGWIEHAAQVGQTGVTVSPQLYISAGISGAVQQRSGMQTAGTIVAINKDEDAPVFEIADFGVVGDLHEVIPQMTEELRRRKG